MCGLVGLISLGESLDLRSTVQTMVATLYHRGPDDEGTWIDESAGIALGHRCLAILDLSPAGHQPMVSACSRYLYLIPIQLYVFGNLPYLFFPKQHQLFFRWLFLVIGYSFVVLWLWPQFTDQA
ncbi:hypothetical protein BRW62_02000 [Parathermosynechococcus lividus PCC 6715]|uniref:asparagine synthase (glutamine-hydrolyzing) n=1 Tax=Parathermosynechococcus lividus PCC 6715 TaxID=1917166 RepID=A0A2D2PZN6_PARLV|nr:hypothetical protein [Thermostichus lividus]ATS17720.1 hypothetical protein BRW62_02000 [Thermostichus lividus PCC 6715]